MSKIVLADKDLPQMLIKFLDNDGQIQSVEFDNIVIYYIREEEGLGIAFFNEGH